jgi:hypothetical protein
MSDRMLDELIVAMRDIHARRRRRRRVTGSAALIALATAIVWGTRPTPHRVVTEPDTPTVVQVVRNMPRTGLVRMIDDEELLRRLAEIDRPTGLIRSEGRSWLTEPVVGRPQV